MFTAFTAFLSIVAVEYMGIAAHYLPLLNTLKYSLLLSFLLLGYVATRNSLADILRYPQTKFAVIFIAMTGSALLHGLIQSEAMEPFQQQVGYFILLTVGYFLINEPTKFLKFAILFTVIHAALALINLDPLTREVREGSYQAGYFLGDGNDFGWSMNVALPFAMYLYYRADRRLLKIAAGVAMLLIIFAIIGTKSRGATLAMAGILGYFWLYVTQSKWKGLVALAVIAAGILVAAPDVYLNRMETIANYEEDSSAMDRLRAWGDAIEMGVDHPLLGVGAGSYNSAYGRFYRDVNAGDPVRWISAHSIYFKVLGEYGFTGLFLFLGWIMSVYYGNRRTARMLSEQGMGPIPHYLPHFLNMSLIGYAIAGAFLTGVNYPHLYLITALSLSARRLAVAESRQGHSVGSTTAVEATD